MKFLILLALSWLHGTDDPLFRVHCSTRQVTCLSEAAVGTSGGLRRLSGGVELPGVPVRALCGSLIASDCGVYEDGRCLDARPTWSLLRTPAGLVSGLASGRVRFWDTGQEVLCPTDAPIHSLAWDGERVLAASNQGLWSLDGQGVQEVRLSSNPVASTVTCVAASGDRVLVGTAAGVFRRKGKDWAALPGAVNVSALAVAPDGHAWVGTADAGVYEETAGSLRQTLPTIRGVTALLCTPQGVVVGTDHGAFLEGRPLYDWQAEISGNQVTALACSKSDVWVGTFQDGLSHGRPGNWSRVEGLPSSWINQLGVSGQEVLVRFSSGLVLSGAGPYWRTMGRSSGWPKDWTSGLGPDWVATLSGFYTRQGKGWKTYVPKPALQGVTVTGVARYGGSYWLGCQNGAYCYDAASGECRQIVRELPDSWVTCLESSGGKLWAGTFRGGLAVFDGHRWSVELPGERIHCLLSTPSGLWVGTPRGLLWTDGREWRRFGREQGMPSEVVWSLAARGEELWVGTDGGLLEMRGAGRRARVCGVSRT